MLFQLLNTHSKAVTASGYGVRLPNFEVLCVCDPPCEMQQETPLAPLGAEFIHFILKTWPSSGLNRLPLAPSPFPTLWTNIPPCGRGFK